MKFQRFSKWICCRKSSVFCILTTILNHREDFRNIRIGQKFQSLYDTPPASSKRKNTMQIWNWKQSMDPVRSVDKHSWMKSPSHCNAPNRCTRCAKAIEDSGTWPVSIPWTRSLSASDVNDKSPTAETPDSTPSTLSHNIGIRKRKPLRITTRGTMRGLTTGPTSWNGKSVRCHCHCVCHHVLTGWMPRLFNMKGNNELYTQGDWRMSTPEYIASKMRSPSLTTIGWYRW